MARPINGLIFKIKYDCWRSGHYIECQDKTDLFNFLADQQLKGYLFLSVNEICPDGSTPKVAVRTDKEFLIILKEKENPKEIKVKEHYWINENGCHYSLTPTEEYQDIISQFWTDTSSLKKARQNGKEWIEKMNYDLRANIILEMNK